MRVKIVSLIVLTLGCGLWLATSAIGQAREQDSSRRTDSRESSLRLKTEIVNLTVTVTDGRNVAVSGLEPDQFQVYEDNVRQQIEYFRCEDEPLSIGIIFDLSESMKGKLKHAREAVKSFMQASHRDDDFFLLGFNQQCHLLADSADADGISKKLEAASAVGRTALYDAVNLGIERLHSGRRAKRALFIISDGADNASRLSKAELTRRLREENILIYCIGYELWSESDEWGRSTLKTLARWTGGAAFFPNSEAELESAVSTIALELRRQYSLAYTTHEGERERQWRKLKVRLTPTVEKLKLRVRTRDGFYTAAGADRSVVRE